MIWLCPGCARRRDLEQRTPCPRCCGFTGTARAAALLRRRRRRPVREASR